MANNYCEQLMHAEYLQHIHQIFAQRQLFRKGTVLSFKTQLDKFLSGRRFDLDKIY